MEEHILVYFCSHCGRVYTGDLPTNGRLPCGHVADEVMSDDLVLKMTMPIQRPGFKREDVERISLYGVANVLKYMAPMFNILFAFLLVASGMALDSLVLVAVGSATFISSLLFRNDVPAGWIMRKLANRYCSESTFKVINKFLQNS